MTSMTNKPLHKNQAGQPSDNGGQFAATARVEAPEGLLADAVTSPRAKLAAAVEAETAAHARVLEAIPDVLRELILDAMPGAATAQFDHFDVYDDGSYFSLANVRDAKGNIIVITSDLRDAVELVTGKTDDAYGLAHQPAFARIQNTPGGRIWYRLDLTVAPRG